MPAPASAFTMRHVQLLRALFAAVAATMITFSSDHSAAVGLSVFSGFVLVTALVQILAAWLVLPAGNRWSYVALAVVGIIAGMASGVPAARSEDLFFIVVSAWAIISGGIELLAGIRSRGDADRLSRDAITVGALGIVFGIALLLIPSGFLHEYTVAEAGTGVLSGIIIGVGILGVYTAIVAVFLGIAGLTPKKVDAAESHNSTAPAEHGGKR